MKKITALAAILAIPAMAAPAGYFQVPGTETTMKIYGKAETWAYYNLTTAGGDKVVVDNPAPTPDVTAPGHQSLFEKGTVNSWTVGRIGVTSTTPSSYGDVNVKVEFETRTKGGSTNSYGNDWRLRHAYGEFHGLLIGQTTSLFNAWHNVPAYNDTFTPDFNGTSRVRQARYTFAPADGFQLGFSIENEKTDGTSAKIGQALVAAGTYSADWGAVTASIGYQKKRDWDKAVGGDVAKMSGSAVSYAVSGVWNITENDAIQAIVAEGLGQHGQAFHDDFIVDGNKYKAYKNRAWGLGYSHNWGNGFDTNVGVGQTIAPKKASLGFDEKITLTEFFVNTNWQVTKTVRWGAEYYMGTTKWSESEPVVKSNGTFTDKYKNSNFNLFFQYNFF